jgi:hypothetical protein
LAFEKIAYATARIRSSANVLCGHAYREATGTHPIDGIDVDQRVPHAIGYGQNAEQIDVVRPANARHGGIAIQQREFGSSILGVFKRLGLSKSAATGCCYCNRPSQTKSV